MASEDFKYPERGGDVWVYCGNRSLRDKEWQIPLAHHSINQAAWAQSQNITENVPLLGGNQLGQENGSTPPASQQSATFSTNLLTTHWADLLLVGSHRSGVRGQMSTLPPLSMSLPDCWHLSLAHGIPWFLSSPILFGVLSHYVISLMLVPWPYPSAAKKCELFLPPTCCQGNHLLSTSPP